MGSMLEAMLNVGLSPALTTALYELAIHIPSFKKDIAEGLLKILSVILMQQQFRHPVYNSYYIFIIRILLIM